MLLVLHAAFAVPQPIVGGAPVEAGDWPDVAALFSGNEFMCSGVLIAPDVVLTAAHCDVGLTRAVLGTHDLTLPGESLPVRQTIAVPNYWNDYDIAVVLLDEAAVTSPRAIALDCVRDQYLHDGAEVVLVGWGKIDEQATQLTDLLHEAQTTITDADCSADDKGCLDDLRPDGEFIAGGQGVDTCNGDSGGPVYARGQGEQAWLVGITSRMADGADVPCGGGGIYTRTDAVIDWIEEKANLTLPRPDCPDGANAPPVASLQGSLSVGEGEVGTLRVLANDPDPNDRHTFEIVAAPLHGQASIDAEGVLSYTAGWDHPDDHVTVRVTDDGVPRLSSTLQVPVRVLPVLVQRAERSCTHGGALALGPWVLLPLLLYRRRRARAD